MTIHDPPHPGEFIISPEMALCLSKALGRSPESWLATQHGYELWQAKKTVKLGQVKSVRFEAV